jgi:hypothetical protein
MIESMLKEDTILRLPTLNAAPPPVGANRFVSVSPAGHGIQLGNKLLSFRWLPWVPGAVSQVELGVLDVLTGPMSGCWLMLYTQGRQAFACHIGTLDSPADPQTLAVKEAWRDFATSAPQNGVKIVSGFNPASAFPPYPQRKPSDSGVEIYGLITTVGRLYSIFFWIQKDLSRRVGALKEVRTAMPDQLKNLS